MQKETGNIKVSVINTLLNFFQYNRRSGTSTLIDKVARDNNVFIIVPFANQGKNFHPSVSKSILSIGEIEDSLPNERKPILVDNSAMLHILRQADNEIKTAEINSLLLEQLIAKMKWDADQKARKAAVNYKKQRRRKPNKVKPRAYTHARVLAWKKTTDRQISILNEKIKELNEKKI